jgi:hypothetical protein
VAARVLVAGPPGRPVSVRGGSPLPTCASTATVTADPNDGDAGHATRTYISPLDPRTITRQ